MKVSQSGGCAKKGMNEFECILRPSILWLHCSWPHFTVSALGVEGWAIYLFKLVLSNYVAAILSKAGKKKHLSKTSISNIIFNSSRVLPTPTMRTLIDFYLAYPLGALVDGYDASSFNFMLTTTLSSM